MKPDQLEKALRDLSGTSVKTRYEAADNILSFATDHSSEFDSATLNELHRALFDSEPKIRWLIASTLEVLARPESVSHLERLLAAEDVKKVSACVEDALDRYAKKMETGTEMEKALRHLAHKRASIYDFPPQGPLIQDDGKFREKNPEHPLSARYRFTRQEGAAYFKGLAQSEPATIDSAILVELHISLFDRDAAVRLAITETLGNLARPESVSHLERLLAAEDESEMVRNAVKDAIKKCLSSPVDKSGLWPDGRITKNVLGKELVIEFTKKTAKNNYRLLDPWAFVAWDYHKDKDKLDSIRFRFDKLTRSPEYEAFKRRASYLKLNNAEINVIVEVSGSEEPLFSKDELFARPSSEVINSRINLRKPVGAVHGKLEKDFQDWLFYNAGKSINSRLAVFGEDFYKIQKKGFTVAREFPTGVFGGIVSKKTRILPTNFIDFVTKNKKGELSIIELKLNDPKLEVISQSLDYVLFFRCYSESLKKLLEEKINFKDAFMKKSFVCYLVNNHYHPYFDKVFTYYKPKPEHEKAMNFRFKKITLGHSA